MRVCYFGTYEPEYVRSRVLLSGLRQCGASVLPCHAPVWTGGIAANKASDWGGVAGRTRLVARFGRAYASLARQYLRLEDHDVVLVGYFGHVDMLAAAALARLRRKPVAFDAYLSLYDSVVHDRGLARDRSVVARVCRALDRLSCALADLVILAEDQSIHYFEGEFGVPRAKLRRLFVGADDATFYPRVHDRRDDAFRVIHFGKYIPLHGMEYVLQAAALLQPEGVQFTLVGTGQLYPSMRALAERLGVRNIRFIPWLDPTALCQEIATADVCLGIFGATEKARRVIGVKVFEALAMGKPVVTGDSPASRELLGDRETAILCRMADPESIAVGIRVLRDDPALRVRIAQNGHELFQKRCSPRAIGETLLGHLEEVVRSRGSGR